MADLAHIPAETLAILENLLPENLHPTLREIVTSLYLHLVEDEEVVEMLGLERLADLAAGQVDRVSLDVGGSHFYLPKGIGYRLSPRDREIVAAHKGYNKRELARKYHLSEVRIDQILANHRKQEFLRRQGTLDLPEAAS